MKRSIAALFFFMTVCYAAAQTMFAHPWQGRRVAYFGDSVTDPAVNTGPDNRHYWSFLADWLDMKPEVYAVNGSQWSDIPQQTERLYNDRGTDIDAIMIFCGTNDYNAGLPIGQWYEETTGQVYAATGHPKTLETRVRRTPAMNPGTFCGRINIALDKIKKTFPGKQIVLITPIHRGYACFGDDNVQPDETWQNKGGLYLDAYTDAVKQAGQVWSVPVVDMASLCGLVPQAVPQQQYFKDKDTDQLHPNEKGHLRMARTLFYQLLALPCIVDGGEL